MANLASINIRFAVDLKQFSTEMQNSLRTIDQVGQKFQAVGRNMSAYVTLPILAAGAASLKFASDYKESLNKVDVSFKTSSGEVKNFAKTTLESFGIAEGTALDMASAYGDMGTSMGLPTSQAAKMSTSLVGLAGDLASFKNISIDIANTALSAIFTGETESLKKMGIVMTEVNLKAFALSSGIKKSYEEMSQAEKVQLRYNYILSVTKNAQGDFERTQGGAANQTRIFQESLKQVGAQLGAVILPLFIKVISAINEKIVAFSKLSDATKTTIVVVAGLVAVIGPLALAIGGILAAIPFVVAGFAAISAAILPVLAGITLLMGAFLILKNATKETTAAQSDLNKAIEAGNKNAVNEVTALDKLYAAATNVKLSTKERKEAVDQLQALYPAYFKNIDAETIKNGKAETSYNQLRNAIFNKSRAAAIDNQLQLNANERISKEIELQDKLAVARKNLDNVQKNGKDENISLGAGTGATYFSSKEQQVKAAALVLKNYKTELANFTAAAIKEDESLLNAKQVYDAKSAKLSQNEIDRKKAEMNASLGMDVPGKTKIKAASNLSSIDSKLSTSSSTGTIDNYDQEISKLMEFRDKVATTPALIKSAQDAIAQLEFAKDLILTPEKVIQITGGFDNLVTEMQAKVGGFQAVSESMKAVFYDLSTAIAESVEQLAENAAVGFGEAIGGVIAGTQNLGSLLSGMLGLVANFMKDLGKQLVAIGIARIAFDKLKLSGVGAVAAGIALIALGTVVSASFNKPKAFANGGIVGGASFYGDKILARVNSGELILNNKQQKAVYGAMSSAVNAGDVAVQIIGNLEVSGDKLQLIMARTSNRNLRTR